MAGDYEAEKRPALLEEARRRCALSMPDGGLEVALLAYRNPKSGPIAAAVLILLLDEVLALRARIDLMERAKL